jgi:hypothetical protein
LQRRLCPADDVVKLGEEGDSPSTTTTTTADTINRIVDVGGANSKMESGTGRAAFPVTAAGSG